MMGGSALETVRPGTRPCGMTTACLISLITGKFLGIDFWMIPNLRFVQSQMVL